MPLKTYDTKEAIPADQQATAVELKDGKWVVEEVDPTLGEKGQRALEEERTARKKEELQRKAAEKERDDLKRKQDALDKGISDEELQKIRNDEAAARKPIEDELAKTKSENRRLKLTDRVQALALKSGVMADRLEDAMLSLSQRTDLTDADGIVVKDKAGNITTETIDVFLKTTFKAEKPWLYVGSGMGGGGAAGSEGAADVPEVTKEEAAIAADARRREVASAF